MRPKSEKFFKRNKKRIKCGAVITGLAGLVISVGMTNPKVEERNSSGPNKIEKDTITVMSSNAARGEGRNFLWYEMFTGVIYGHDKSKKGLEALENLIREEDVDIGCFQEIEETYIREEHQPKRFSENTQLKNYVFGQNFAYNAFKFFPFADGNAILSKTTLFESSMLPFETGRSMGVATFVNIVAGSKGILHTKVSYQDVQVNILCTHTSSNGVEDREDEFRIIFEYAVKNTPAILMGDLNTVPLGSRDKDFSDGHDFSEEKSWYIAKEIIERNNVKVQYDPRLKIFNADEEHTFPGTYLGYLEQEELGLPNTRSDIGKTIDYIIILSKDSDKVELELVDTEVKHDLNYSDHAPLISKIKVSL